MKLLLVVSSLNDIIPFSQHFSLQPQVDKTFHFIHSANSLHELDVP